MNSAFDRKRVLASRKAAEQNQIEVVQCNKSLTNEEKSKQIAKIQAEYNEYVKLFNPYLCAEYITCRLNARLFETKEAHKARVDDIRADIAAKKRSQRKENERFFCNVCRDSEFFNKAQTLLNELFPCTRLEFSEYVYSNRLGEMFFFVLPDFAPNYAVAVINSANRLSDFDYDPLLSKPVPFLDLSRIQIDPTQIKQQIYDQFDLVYHDSTITKAACFNSSLFIRDPLPNLVLKATSYEDYSPTDAASNESDINNYSHHGKSFALGDFIQKCQISRGKKLDSKDCTTRTVSIDEGGNNLKNLSSVTEINRLFK